MGAYLVIYSALRNKYEGLAAENRDCQRCFLYFFIFVGNWLSSLPNIQQEGHIRGAAEKGPLGRRPFPQEGQEGARGILQGAEKVF